MSKHSSAGAATALAESYDFGQHRRVLDVGGGTGSFLISILRRYTGVQGTLFELPGEHALSRVSAPLASRRGHE